MSDKDYITFDEQVDRFLRNQMTVEESADFKAELSADAEKMQRAKTIALMVKSMEKVGRQQDQQLVDTIRHLDEKQFRRFAGLKPNTISFWPKILRYASVACLAGILCLGGYKYYDYRQTVSLGQIAYHTYAADLSTTLPGKSRGSECNDTDIVTELSSLFSKVEKGEEMRPTIEELEVLYTKSLDEFSPYNEYVDDIAWNLSVAYLKVGERKKPIPILEDMVERNASYPQIVQPAQILIDKIKAL